MPLQRMIYTHLTEPSTLQLPKQRLNTLLDGLDPGTGCERNQPVTLER
jgi:hypothetical protein